MLKRLNRKYHDFNARMCAIRETFEEINLLIVRPLYSENNFSRLMTDPSMRKTYVEKYKSNFLLFCKDQNIVPDFQQIYGYRKNSNGSVPGLDN